MLPPGDPKVNYNLLSKGLCICDCFNNKKQNNHIESIKPLCELVHNTSKQNLNEGCTDLTLWDQWKVTRRTDLVIAPSLHFGQICRIYFRQQGIC